VRQIRIAFHGTNVRRVTLIAISDVGNHQTGIHCSGIGLGMKVTDLAIQIGMLNTQRGLDLHKVGRNRFSRHMLACGIALDQVRGQVDWQRENAAKRQP